MKVGYLVGVRQWDRRCYSQGWWGRERDYGEAVTGWVADGACVGNILKCAFLITYIKRFLTTSNSNVYCVVTRAFCVVVYVWM